ncbi:paraquat-inducible protein A [Pigmentiphaga soli]|uniref:Paraquat-inducible protein A n=1 Tax=Pigmentiphaga soli TaxID=1007095 RepID=A0ABP8GCC9_9BURK
MLSVCEHCDAVYLKTALRRAERAYCVRCGSELYAERAGQYEALLPIVLAAFIVFLISNAFPIVTMEIQGQSTQTTVWQSVVVLANEGMLPVAALVFATTIFFPAAEMLLLLYVLVPLALGRVAPGFGLVLRAVRIGRPWGMIEVFLLGIIAALVKLSTLADLVPGMALWSFGILTVLLALVLRVDPKGLWDQAERCER